MRIAVLAFVLWACVARAFLSPSGIPVFLHTIGGGPSVLVANIATGVARVPRLFALLDADTTRVRISWAVQEEVVLWIGGVPRHFESEPLPGPVPGCAVCAGVLPIGRGSPLWNPYANITLTGDAILFDERRISDRPPPLPCAFHPSGLCDLPARFQGTPTTLRLDFSRAATRVPSALFFDYVQDKHPLSTPARDWDDIHIELDGGPTIRIPGRGAVSTHLGFEPRLFLEPHDGSEILAGADLLRYASFFWDVGAATVAVEPRVSVRGYSWYVSVLIALCVLGWFQMRDLHRPGVLSKIVGAASVVLGAGAGVLVGRVLLDDVPLLVLASVVWGVCSVSIVALLFVGARRGSILWLWLDHVRTALALTNIFLAGLLLTLETRVYFYSSVPVVILALSWLYTTYEHWAVVFRDTRKTPARLFAAGWAVGLAWALVLTVGLHVWVFLPAMLSVAPGGGLTPTLLLLCVYVVLGLAATYVVGLKHRNNKKYIRSFH